MAACPKKGGRDSRRDTVRRAYMLLSRLVKAELRLLPIAVQAATQTTAIKAAINPYSIAVTPDLSLKRSLKSACTVASVMLGVTQNALGILDWRLTRSRELTRRAVAPMRRGRGRLRFGFAAPLAPASCVRGRAEADVAGAARNVGRTGPRRQPGMLRESRGGRPTAERLNEIGACRCRQWHGQAVRLRREKPKGGNFKGWQAGARINARYQSSMRPASRRQIEPRGCHPRHPDANDLRSNMPRAIRRCRRRLQLVVRSRHMVPNVLFPSPRRKRAKAGAQGRWRIVGRPGFPLSRV